MDAARKLEGYFQEFNALSQKSKVKHDPVATRIENVFSKTISETSQHNFDNNFNKVYNAIINTTQDEFIDDNDKKNLIDLQNKVQSVVFDLLVADRQSVRQDITNLFSAINSGDLGKVKTFIENGIGPNVKEALGNTPLHVAIENDHKDIVNFLIENGASLNAKNNEKNTPLHLAVLRGHKDIVNSLIKNDASLNAKNNDEKTPLHLAILIDRKDIVDIFIEKTAELDVKPNHGENPLYLAIIYNKKDIAKLLVAKKAEMNIDLNLPDKYGKSALHHAFAIKNEDLIKELISAGADPYAADLKGNSLISLVVGYSQPEAIPPMLDMIDNLLKSRNNTSQPAKGIEYDKVPVTEHYKVPVNKHGETLLHIACKDPGNIELVKYLMKHVRHEVALSSRDENGDTPLHLAILNNKQMAMDIITAIGQLGDLGKDILNVQNNTGYTPLQIAAYNGDISLVESLVSNGADINSRCDIGSALMIALARNQVKFVKFLISKKAELNIDLNLTDKYGRSALHYALATKNEDLIKELISAGANPYAADLKGNSLISLIVENSPPEVALHMLDMIDNLLKSRNNTSQPAKGIEYDKVPVNEHGDTLLHIACKDARNVELVKYLIEHVGPEVALSSRDTNGNTPLHFATKNEQITNAIITAIGQLGDLGKNIINMRNDNGYTPLDTAAYSGNIRLAESLVSNGADINSRGDIGSALMIALARNQVKFVKFLISKKAELNIDLNLTDKYGRSALHYALATKNEDLIKELISAGANPYAADLKGNSLISLIVENSPPEVALHMLDMIDNLLKSRNNTSQPAKGIEYDKVPVNEHGDTLLHIACKDDRNVELVKYLIEHVGPEVALSSRDSNGNTPLHSATKKEQITKAIITALEQLGNLGKDILKIRNNHGYTPLDVAAYNGDIILANGLVSNGADINSRGDTGSALMIALARNQDEFVTFLISKKAELNITDQYRQSALHHAFAAKNEDLIKELISAGADPYAVDVNRNSLISLIVENSPPEVVPPMLDIIDNLLKSRNNTSPPAKGIEYDKVPVNEFGKTLLHIVCEDTRNVELVKYLIEHVGPKVALSSGDANGNTPLHLAIKERNIEIAKLLIEKGIGLDLQSKDGSTPLHLAIRDGNVELAKLLIENKAKLDVKDKDGNTALHDALRQNNEILASYIIRTIASMGPDGLSIINTPNTDGYTPLHVAAVLGLKNITEALLQNGAKLDDQTKGSKFTPLMLALLKGNRDLAEFLITAGANIQLISMNGKTALHFASELNFDDLIIQLIIKGANPYATDFDRNSPIFYIVNNKPKDMIIPMLQTINAALSANGLDYNKIPTNGSYDTLLHAAFRRGNFELINFLFANGMFNKALEKNIYYETPYSQIFNKELMTTDPKSMMHIVNIMILQGCLASENHQKAISEEIQKSGIHGFSSYLQEHAEELLKDPKALDINPLEIPLFLNDYALAQKMKVLLPEDKFNKYLGEIVGKYGAVADEFCKIQNFLYTLNPSHLQKGLSQLPAEMAKTSNSTEEKPEFVKLESLLEMLDDVYESNSESVIPKSFQGDDRSKDSLKKVLEGFIDKVKNRTKYLGIPDNDEDRIRTYETIEIAQTHIIKALQIQDKKRQAEVLRKLIEEVQLCGGKLYSLSLDLYDEVCQGEIPSFEGKTYKMLADLRMYDILANVPTDSQNVHFKNELTKLFGLEFGLPGGQAASEFKDKYRSFVNLDKDKAREAFFKRYNSYAIANYIRENLKDSDYKDLFVKWAEKNEIDIGFQAPEQFKNAINEIRTNPAWKPSPGLPKNFQADIIGICSVLGFEEEDNLAESDYSKILDTYFNATTWMDTDFDMLTKEGGAALEKIDPELKEILMKEIIEKRNIKDEKLIIECFNEMFLKKNKYSLAEIKKPLLAMYCEKYKIVSPSDSQMSEIFKKLGVFL